MGWLRNKIGRWATDSQAEELQRFLLSLRGMDAEELAGLVIMATVARLKLSAGNLMPPEFLGHGVPMTLDQQTMVPLQLSQITRDLQRANALPQAASMMVWLHSARAIVTPELRLHGRQMWAELARGFDDLDLAFIGLQRISAESLPDEIVAAAHYIPPALTPLE